jgi:UDP-N-acetylmuramate--alanine ligase
VKKRFVTYGLTTQADLYATDISHREDATSFVVYHKGTRLGRLSLRMPGRHNVLNALAAVAVAVELGVPFQLVEEGFEDFCGVGRRFQIRYQQDNLLVVDDYGHHPAEIKATLAAARAGWDNRLIAVFQPHRYSRTAALFEDFATAFYAADVVVVLDIYAAGEEPLPEVTAEALAKAIAGHGHREVRYLASLEEATRYLLATVRSGDMVITLGAGNVWQVGAELSEGLTTGKPPEQNL